MTAYSNLSKEQLIAEIKRLKKRKKFGIVWEDKPEDVAEQCKTSLPVLKEEKKKDISSDKGDIAHIIIEGDNYHALAVLNYTHKRKIDVIYIDPPYNTGNKDFKYNDRYIDKEDTYRHSKWLSFMAKRLKLAKGLLLKDGLIFISIDDHEHAQLKMLCNEIFSERNFIGTITWEKRTKAQNTETAKEMFQSKTEYILVYKNDSEKVRFKLEVSGKKIYNLEDKKGLYRLKLVEEMSALGMRGRQTMIFDIEGIKPRKGYQWKVGKEQVEKYKAKNDIEIIEGKAYFKVRPKDETSQRFLPFWSHFFDKDTYGTSERGKSELTKILGGNDHEFETVKPINLIKKLLFHINKDNAIVLDFFAGSGTTGHAILEMNEQDGGNRQFILCTDNKNYNGNGTRIVSDICYPRIKNAIRGYAAGGKKVKGLGGNLKYFSTLFVDNVKTDNDKRIFTSRCTEMLCLAEGTFGEVIKKQNAFSIYENRTQMTGIIYDEDAIADFKREAGKYKKPFVVYVFSYDHTYNEEDFEDLSSLRTVKPIPEVILNIYRKIYKELYKPRHL